MRLQLFGILILLFIGLFLHPFEFGIWDFIYRFLIFMLITYLIYRNLQLIKLDSTQETTVEPTKTKVPLDTDLDNFDNWNIDDLLNEDDTVKNYLHDQFHILASILIPDNGWIFYFNNENALKVIYQHSFSEETTEHVPDKIQINGILKILENRNEILIEDDLKTAIHSLTYYQGSNYIASSFIGIPIPIGEREKLLITFDSKTPQQFNHQDNPTIEKIVKGIQSTIHFRIKSVSLISKVNYNQKLLDFALNLNKSNTVSTAIKKLTEFISYEFEADRLTICTVQNDSSKAVIRQVVGQIDIFPQDTEFFIDEGLAGWVIGKKKPYLIEDLEKGEYFIPRYSKEEKSNYGLRSFLGIPFLNEDNVYGAVTLEHKVASKYSEYDKLYLQKVSEIFTTIFLRKKFN